MNEIPSVSKANQQLVYLRNTHLNSKQLSGTNCPPYDLEILLQELAYFPCIDQRADRMSFTINVRVNI